MKKFILPIIMLVTLGAGCLPVVRNQQPTPLTVAPTNTTITFFGPKNQGDKIAYCNGAEMDSARFKNSLTKMITKVVPGDLTLKQKIVATLTYAANDLQGFNEDGTYTRAASITFENGTVTLYPAGGWAGSSIFMCAWQPFVEKQLEQFPEVKKVEWSEVN